MGNHRSFLLQRKEDKMNHIQVFVYQTNQVRTVEINGELWFVLKDVCAAFGEANYRRVAGKLDEDEKGVSQIATPGGEQGMTIVSESGLYSVLFAMQPEKARGVDDAYVAKRLEQLKTFRRWVTHEVLPSIHKNGGYIAGQEELTPQELMAKALLVAQKTIEDREARISNLETQNQAMKPKAEYFDELVSRNMLTNFRETAKELKLKEKDFIGWLLANRYVYRDQKGKLMPYTAKNDGLFEVKEGKGRYNDWAGTQTLITPKGRATFRLLCRNPS